MLLCLGDTGSPVTILKARKGTAIYYRHAFLTLKRSFSMNSPICYMHEAATRRISVVLLAPRLTAGRAAPLSPTIAAQLSRPSPQLTRQAALLPQAALPPPLYKTPAPLPTCLRRGLSRSLSTAQHLLAAVRARPALEPPAWAAVGPHQSAAGC